MKITDSRNGNFKFEGKNSDKNDTVWDEHQTKKILGHGLEMYAALFGLSVG